jgi:Mg2+ and Co2+ transporter CorA
MTTHDELVERVARLYEQKWGVSDHWLATAAIAVVLEEAAKVCDEIETAEHRKWKQYADMMAQGASDGAGDCAAAIRALIKKESA